MATRGARGFFYGCVQLGGGDILVKKFLKKKNLLKKLEKKLFLGVEAWERAAARVG